MKPLLRLLPALLGPWLLFALQILADDAADVSALVKQRNQLTQAGKYHEAIPVAEKVVQLREKASGPDALIVAVALNNLASLYEQTGNNAKAAEHYERVLRIREKALGPADPKTIAARQTLAEVCAKMGDNAKAETLRQGVTEASKDAVSKRKPKGKGKRKGTGTVTPSSPAGVSAAGATTSEARKEILGRDRKAMATQTGWFSAFTMAVVGGVLGVLILLAAIYYRRKKQPIEPPATTATEAKAEPPGDADAAERPEGVAATPAEAGPPKEGVQIIKFTCPHCGNYIEAEGGWAGMTLACPHASCGKQIVLPSLPVPRSQQATPTVSPSPDLTPRVKQASSSRFTLINRNVLSLKDRTVRFFRGERGPNRYGEEPGKSGHPPGTAEDEASAVLREAIRLESQGSFQEALSQYQRIMDVYPYTSSAQDAEKSIEAILQKVAALLPRETEITEVAADAEESRQRAVLEYKYAASRFAALQQFKEAMGYCLLPVALFVFHFFFPVFIGFLAILLPVTGLLGVVMVVRSLRELGTTFAITAREKKSWRVKLSISAAVAGLFFVLPLVSIVAMSVLKAVRTTHEMKEPNAFQAKQKVSNAAKETEKNLKALARSTNAFAYESKSLTHTLDKAADNLDGDAVLLARIDKAMLTNLQPMMARFKSADAQISKTNMLDFRNVTDKTQLASRRALAEEFVAAAREVKQALANYETDYRNRLAELNMRPDKIDAFMRTFRNKFRDSQTHAIQLCEINLRVGDALLKMTSLLETHWGAWRVDESGKISGSSELSEQYNALLREISTAAQELQRLKAKLLETQR